MGTKTVLSDPAKRVRLEWIVRERATYDVPSMRTPPISQDPVIPAKVIRCMMDSHLIRRARIEGINSNRGMAEASKCSHRIECEAGGLDQDDARTVVMYAAAPNKPGDAAMSLRPWWAPCSRKGTGSRRGASPRANPEIALMPMDVSLPPNA